MSAATAANDTGGGQLTARAAETDVVQGYNLGANCYVVKPIDFKTFQNIVQAVEGFWFTIVKLPAAPEDARSGAKPRSGATRNR